MRFTKNELPKSDSSLIDFSDFCFQKRACSKWKSATRLTGAKPEVSSIYFLLLWGKREKTTDIHFD